MKVIGSGGWRAVDFARGWGVGFVATVVLLLLLNGAGVIAHRDQAGIRAHILQGLPGIETGRSSRDAATDCVVLAGVAAGASSPFAYLLSPRNIAWDFAHRDTCKNLRYLVAGDDTIGLVNYDRYWFGSIYLGALLLIFFGLSTVQTIYKVTTILSIVSLGLVGLRLKPPLRLPLVVMSLGIFGGAGVASFGGNLGHSPVFFVGLTVIVGFLSFPNRPWNVERAALFGAAVGAVAVYFDLLSGGIPFLLALSVFASYLLCRQDAPSDRDVLALCAGIAAVMLAFCFSVVALVALKLFVAQAALGHSDAVATFKSELLWRMSDDKIPATGIAAIAYVLRELWADRGMVFFGGKTGADIVFAIGALSWLAAGVGAGRNYLASRGVADLLPIGVSLLAASVVLAWFAVFQSHSVIHAWFMVRILCLVPTFGIAAAAMVYVQTAASEPSRSPRRLGGSG